MSIRVSNRTTNALRMMLEDDDIQGANRKAIKREIIKRKRREQAHGMLCYCLECM